MMTEATATTTIQTTYSDLVSSITSDTSDIDNNENKKHTYKIYRYPLYCSVRQNRALERWNFVLTFLRNHLVDEVYNRKLHDTLSKEEVEAKVSTLVNSCLANNFWGDDIPDEIINQLKHDFITKLYKKTPFRLQFNLNEIKIFIPEMASKNNLKFTENALYVKNIGWIRWNKHTRFSNNATFLFLQKSTLRTYQNQTFKQVNTNQWNAIIFCRQG